ncbi:MAG: hypothetical protein ACR2H0_02915, partial [Candidatus Limnocylindrales bacterium]
MHNLSNDYAHTLKRLAAIGSALVFVVGCGISGQSPSPRASSAASQPAQATSTPRGSASATGSAATATGTPVATASAAATASPTDPPPATPQPTLAGEVVFGNWPLYIDIDEETGGYPTLEAFTDQTG